VGSQQALTWGSQVVSLGRGEGRKEESVTVTLAGELHFQKVGGENTKERGVQGVPDADCARGTQRVKPNGCFLLPLLNLSGLFNESPQSSNNED